MYTQLMIRVLPNGMMNVPAHMLTEVGLDDATASQLIQEAKLARVRLERDKRLQETDKTQLSDTPYSSEQRAAWRLYRQALRDLPEQLTDLEQINWPKPPEQ